MSKKTKTEASATDAPATTPAPVRHCACGCGTEVKKRSLWRQGHDARAKGWLQRAGAGRMFEGEREQAIALLQRGGPALESEMFVPLAAAARAALGLEDEAAA